MITLTIDPGVKHLGVSVFGGDKLIHAVLIETEDKTALSEVVFTYGYPDQIVIECPQVYARSKSAGDPNDLIDVARVVGRLEERLAFAELVKPRAWKGTVKKEVMLKRILEKLSPTELSLLPKLPKSLVHNVVDAVGIGLFSVGRMKKKLASKKYKR